MAISEFPRTSVSKRGLRAQPLIWKWFFIVRQIKLISTRKVVRLASFWKWGFWNSEVAYWPNRSIDQSLIPSTDVIRLTLTLKMTTARVVETSVTVNNNGPIQDYVHLDDQTQPTLMKCAVPSITPLSPNYREDVGNQFPFITQLSNAPFTYGCFKNHCVKEYN